MRSRMTSHMTGHVISELSRLAILNIDEKSDFKLDSC